MALEVEKKPQRRRGSKQEWRAVNSEKLKDHHQLG